MEIAGQDSNDVTEVDVDKDRSEDDEKISSTKDSSSSNKNKPNRLSFKCTVCNMFFSQSYNLNRHIMRKHSNENNNNR